MPPALGRFSTTTEFPGCAKLLRDQPGEHIRQATGREGHDDRHGTRGKPVAVWAKAGRDPAAPSSPAAAAIRCPRAKLSAFPGMPPSSLRRRSGVRFLLSGEPNPPD
jgi:hypothetical protein